MSYHKRCSRKKEQRQDLRGTKVPLRFPADFRCWSFSKLFFCSSTTATWVVLSHENPSIDLSFSSVAYCTLYSRRRIRTEEKAKVVAAVWGAEFIQIPCLFSCFAPGRFEEKDEFILFCISSWWN